MTVGLALGSAMHAGITVGGELMRAPPKYTHLKSGEGDCNWICPLGRCRHELGLDYHCTTRGPRLSGGMLKEPIYGVVIGGLPFLTWDQFQIVRWALQQSHQGGRQPARKFCGEDCPPTQTHQGEWPEWCNRQNLNVVREEIEELMIQSWENDPVYPTPDEDDKGDWNLVTYRKNRFRPIKK